jgi:hypothetical protein
MTTVVEIKDPSKLSKFDNLLLNMLGGLEWKDLSDEEKQLCRDNGYDPEK